MEATDYAKQALQAFLFLLLILIYSPFSWGVAYGDNPIPNKFTSNLYLLLLFGFFVSVIVYVVLTLVEDGNNWLMNIFRKPITYWNADPTENQVDAEEHALQEKMQPSALLSFIAYPLMIYAFHHLSQVLLKEQQFELYGAGSFFNPFKKVGAMHRAVSNNGIKMQAMKDVSMVGTLSDQILGHLLTTLSSLVFVFNYGALVELMFPEKWKAIGSVLLSAITSFTGLAYHITKLYKGEMVLPMGSMTTFDYLYRFLKVFGIMFTAIALIGYPVNPLLNGLREYLGPNGYLIPIISSIATLTVA